MIQFGQAEMVQLVRDIWTTMLDIELQADQLQIGMNVDPDDTCAVPANKSAHFGACVQIAGVWNGAVRLDCSAALARQAAAKFLALAPRQVTVEQIRDAMGELANMTAGSIKPLLPKPCHISLPSVVDGNDYKLTIRKGHIALHTRLCAEQEELLVTLLESDQLD